MTEKAPDKAIDEMSPLSEDFALHFPQEFAYVLARGDSADADAILVQLPPATRAAVLARLPGGFASRFLPAAEAESSELLAKASFDDVLTLLSRLPRDRRLALVNGLPDRERRRQLLRHQQYPAHSVGALVGQVPQRFHADAPAREAILELRELDPDEPGPMVVVDSQGRYVGALNLWSLLSQKRATGAVRDYVSFVAGIYPETSVANAVANADWGKHSWLPVVDGQRRVLGAVSRTALFSASGKHRGDKPGSGDFLLGLLNDMVWMLGNLTNLLFGKNRSS